MSSHAAVALSGLILLLQAGAGVGQVPARPASVRLSDAESLTRKIDTIQQRAKAPVPRRAAGTVLVTETEMNAWLASSEDNRPKGVSEMTVRFQPQRLVARGLVDIELLKPKLKLSPWNPLAWVTGIVPVDVVGRVESRDGTATVLWEDVRVAAIPVAPAMLRDLVVTATRGSKRFPEGFDITAPYRMPYDVRRVRLETSRALLDF